MDERRRHPREPVSENIKFSLTVHEFLEAKRIEAEGNIVNKSESGLCLKTHFPLESGHVLIINNNEIGVVRWSRKVNSHYLAGIILRGRVPQTPFL